MFSAYQFILSILSVQIVLLILLKQFYALGLK